MKEEVTIWVENHSAFSLSYQVFDCVIFPTCQIWYPEKNQSMSNSRRFSIFFDLLMILEFQRCYQDY